MISIRYQIGSKENERTEQQFFKNVESVTFAVVFIYCYCSLQIGSDSQWDIIGWRWSIHFGIRHIIEFWLSARRNPKWAFQLPGNIWRERSNQRRTEWTWPIESEAKQWCSSLESWRTALCRSLCRATLQTPWSLRTPNIVCRDVCSWDRWRKRKIAWNEGIV